MNLIITDCFNDKMNALEAVSRGVFGLNNYNIIQKEHKNLSTPLSPKGLEDVLVKKISHLEHSFESENMNTKGDTVWFCTIQKGFLQINKCWILYAAAVFKKQQGVCFTGQSEGSALKKELWPFIDVPDEERYQKLKEFDKTLESQPLIQWNSRINQTDWYKQSLRNCMLTAVAS